MAALLPGQFDLDGFVFGAPSDPITVPTGGWSKGGFDVRDQDVDAPLRDGRMFGRDRHSPGSWQLDLIVHGLGPILDIAAGLATAWRADTVRATPGARSTLRYNEHGVTRRVYGRPRKFSWAAEEIADPTFRIAAADFLLDEGNVYGDDEASISLNLVTTTAGGGLILPVILPAILGTTTDTIRKGVAVIGGTVPTPLRVVINGPISGAAANVRLTAGDWTLLLTTPVTHGQTIVLDTGAGTLTRDGVPFAGVSRTSSLSWRVPPGAVEFVFTADDPTATASASVSWRPADPII